MIVLCKRKFSIYRNSCNFFIPQPNSMKQILNETSDQNLSKRVSLLQTSDSVCFKFAAEGEDSMTV
jgi:hypothetical protein